MQGGLNDLNWDASMVSDDMESRSIGGVDVGLGQRSGSGVDVMWM